MSAGSTPFRRIAAVDPHAVDLLIALALTCGALVDASSQLQGGLDGRGFVTCSLLTASVALRRWIPVVSTTVAITGFAAFVWGTGYAGDGAFEVAALALNFYLLGRRMRGRNGLITAAALFSYWLAGTAVITYSVPAGSVGEVIGPWVVVGLLPFALGRTLETRRRMTRELEARREQLESEQEMRARHAAVGERTRIARELHDVIAHCVSVIVVQTCGARRIAREDVSSAETALALVERSGREALAELRRLVGVVRRGGDAPPGVSAPLLVQLDPLFERARAGGVEIDLHVEGHPHPLQPEVQLVAYRFVQEALTNVLKHAGHVPARVDVSFGARELELRVHDGGRGPRQAGKQAEREGHGLTGMGERVAIHGGSLRAGWHAEGGFEVHARLSLDGAVRAAEPAIEEGPARAATPADGGRFRWWWLDPSLAALTLGVLEAAVLSSASPRGPSAVNAVAVAAVALTVLWRRRAPLVLLLAAGAYGVASGSVLTSLTGSPLVGAPLLIVPIYSVAAWEDRRRAALGLALALAGAALADIGTPGNLAGAVFVIAGAWGAGRALRARRLLTAELAHAAARLRAEQADRARLAVAGERNRVARELHAAIAGRVEAIVVQAAMARAMLADQSVAADLAMGSIEDSGRETLAEMRRILGVLRRTREGATRTPQPGVNEIHALVRAARASGQQIDLRVEGEPGALPASVDFGIYRILEEGLRSARLQPAGTVAVLLRFGLHDLELELTSDYPVPALWPTDAMRERIRLCGGQLDARTRETTAGSRFRASVPRSPHVALAAE